MRSAPEPLKYEFRFVIRGADPPRRHALPVRLEPVPVAEGPSCSVRKTKAAPSVRTNRQVIADALAAAFPGRSVQRVRGIAAAGQRRPDEEEACWCCRRVYRRRTRSRRPTTSWPPRRMRHLLSVALIRLGVNLRTLCDWSEAFFSASLLRSRRMRRGRSDGAGSVSAGGTGPAQPPGGCVAFSWSPPASSRRAELPPVPPAGHDRPRSSWPSRPGSPSVPPASTGRACRASARRRRGRPALAARAGEVIDARPLFQQGEHLVLVLRQAQEGQRRQAANGLVGADLPASRQSHDPLADGRTAAELDQQVVFVVPVLAHGGPHPWKVVGDLCVQWYSSG